MFNLIKQVKPGNSVVYSTVVLPVSHQEMTVTLSALYICSSIKRSQPIHTEISPALCSTLITKFYLFSVTSVILLHSRLPKLILTHPSDDEKFSSKGSLHDQTLYYLQY